MRGIDLLGVCQCQQCPGMTHIQLTIHQQRLYWLGQVQQAQQIGHRHTRSSHGFRCRLVGHGELLDQAVYTLRLLQGIKVFPLDVFDQGHLQRSLVGHVTHQNRYRSHAGQLACAPATLPGNDFKTPARDRTRQNRLHQSLCLDRVRKFRERLAIHSGTRLVFPRNQTLHR